LAKRYFHHEEQEGLEGDMIILIFFLFFKGFVVN
jgi:hypothetical protein